jgi:DNA replication licensing factor MCM5
MSGFEADRVYSVQTREVQRNDVDGPQKSEIEKQLLQFLLQYRVENQFIYRCV